VPLHFLALQVQLVVLVSAFVMVSTFWSVFCSLLFYLWCPRVYPFVKVGARAPVPYGVGAGVTVVRIVYHILQRHGTDRRRNRTVAVP